MNARVLRFTGAMLLCVVAGACKPGDPDVSSELASVDAGASYAELSRFGAGVAWLHAGETRGDGGARVFLWGVSVVDANRDLRNVYTLEPGTDGRLTNLTATADSLFFVRSPDGLTTDPLPSTLLRYRSGHGKAEPIARSIPRPREQSASIGRGPGFMLARGGRVLYCEERTDSRGINYFSAPLVAIDVEAPVSAEDRSRAPWTKSLTLPGAFCRRLAVDATHLYIESSLGLVRVALSVLDDLLTNGGTALAPEMVLAAAPADIERDRLFATPVRLLGIGASEVYVLADGLADTKGRILALPKAGGAARLLALLPKESAQPVVSADPEPTIYFVAPDLENNGFTDGGHVMVHERGGGDRELTVPSHPQALMVDGSRLLYVRDELGHERATLRELGR
jgi:hypothetical protein